MTNRETVGKTVDAENRVTCEVRLVWQVDKLPVFYPLLERGVVVDTKLEKGVGATLCEALGITTERLFQRIRAIFLDGKIVQDIDNTKVRQGSTVAIGAVLTEPFLRCSLGFWGDSVKGETQGSQPQLYSDGLDGFFNLKIYNVLAKEFGPRLFRAGVGIRPELLEDFLGSRTDMFWHGMTKAEINGLEVSVDQLRQKRWLDEPGLVRLFLRGA
ncbi:hypothetical protein ACFL2Q_01950 [Thermodesulfobacteriota bacterium]